MNQQTLLPPAKITTLWNDELICQIDDGDEWDAVKEALREPILAADLASAERGDISTDITDLLSALEASRQEYRITFASPEARERFSRFLDACDETKRSRALKRLEIFATRAQVDPLAEGFVHPSFPQVRVTWSEPISIRYVIDDARQRIAIIGVSDIAPPELPSQRAHQQKDSGPLAKEAHSSQSHRSIGADLEDLPQPFAP
jgi:hypothetical protein